jgi:hypothetical protein
MRRQQASESVPILPPDRRLAHRPQAVHDHARDLGHVLTSGEKLGWRSVSQKKSYSRNNIKKKKKKNLEYFKYYK